MELATDRLDTRPAGTGQLERLIALLPARAVVLVTAVGLAYNHSLAALTTGFGQQTPLAYLAIVPPVSLILGAINFRLQPNLRTIHDRQLDWIIGLLLIAVAASIDVLLPSSYSADFWLHRIDMIGLPFFAAGMVALLYGTRRLWALRWAVLFLFLAWPDPYVTVLAGAIGTSTNFTLSAVEASMRLAPVAQSLGGGNFLVTHGGQQFSVAVESACSGINGLVGFVVMGAALSVVLSGGLLRRVLWLASGLILVGAFNVVRIDLGLVAGWALGQQFALAVLHPVAGIVVFGIGALTMLGIAPAFRLRIPEPLPSDSPIEESGPARGRRIKLPALQHLRNGAPMAIGLVLALMLAVPDASLAHYDSVVDAFGSPTVGAIDPAGVAVAGWQAGPASAYGQASALFGPHSTWERVALSATDLTASGPSKVYLDVIRTDDSGSLAAHGIESCYQFHGFGQVSAYSSDVGAGVQARVASYRNPLPGVDWSLLWWEWPYQAGGQTRYERLVLLAPLDSAAAQPGSATSQSSFAGAESTIESLARTIVRADLNGSGQSSGLKLP